MIGGPKRAHRPVSPAEEMRRARGWLAPSPGGDSFSGPLHLASSPSGYAGLPYSVELRSKREHFKKPHSASTNLLASCVLISHWLRSHTTNPESIWEKTSRGCD